MYPLSAPRTGDAATSGRLRFLSLSGARDYTSAARATCLQDVLAQAVPVGGAVEVVFAGMDRGIDGGLEQNYARSLSIEDAMHEDVLLAWNMNGAPLPPQHGFPMRLVVPGWYGMASVKWLRSITVVDAPFTGFQQTFAYRLRQEPGEPGAPVTRIEPRALLIPPGWPDFMSRARFLSPGPLDIRGRAWSGHAPVRTVEVSTDDGRTWNAATLDAETDRWAWRGWTFRWDAGRGQHVLCARATDDCGRTQPVEQAWNLGGFANNLVQRVPVLVLDC